MGKHKLIFEGGELVGKSYIISEVYNHLELRYNTGTGVMDGCHWINCDVGIFGTSYGKPIIDRYLEMAEILADKNLIFEKFHISDIVYNRLHRDERIAYPELERQLAELGFKLVVISVTPDPELYARRIKDRLNLYPHYERILQTAEWYIRQQEMILDLAKKSRLDTLIVDATELPGSAGGEILKWLGEK